MSASGATVSVCVGYVVFLLLHAMYAPIPEAHFETSLIPELKGASE